MRTWNGVLDMVRKHISTFYFLAWQNSYIDTLNCIVLYCIVLYYDSKILTNHQVSLAVNNHTQKRFCNITVVLVFVYQTTVAEIWSNVW